jgi:hypothetical protein
MHTHNLIRQHWLCRCASVCLIHTLSILLLIISHSLFLLCLPCITAHFFPLIALLSLCIYTSIFCPCNLFLIFCAVIQSFNFSVIVTCSFYFIQSYLSFLSDNLLPIFCMFFCCTVHFVSLIFFHHLCSVLQSSREDLQQFSVQFLFMYKKNVCYRINV